MNDLANRGTAYAVSCAKTSKEVKLIDYRKLLTTRDTLHSKSVE